MAECLGSTDDELILHEFCGPCQQRQDNVTSEYWCNTCEEGLCTDCNRVHMTIKICREHKTLSFAKFRELQEHIGKMSTSCQVHNLELELYCPNHESACCSKCTDTTHSKCIGIKSLPGYATAYQESNPYDSIDHKFMVLLNNLDKITSDRSDRKQHIDMSRSTIKTQISKFCEDVTTALLRAADEVTNDVDRLALEKMSEIDKVLTSLRDKKQEVEGIKETYLACKDVGNNVQILTCCKKTEKEITDTDSFIEDIIEKGDLTNTTLEISIDKHFKECVVHALKLSVQNQPNPLKLERYDGNAQYITHDISKISTELTEKIDTSAMKPVTHISSITSNSDVLLLAAYDNRQVWKLSKGTFVSVTYDGCPFAMTFISNGTFAVSFPFKHCIKLVRIEDLKEERNIEIGHGGQPWGLDYNSRLLMIAVRDREIQLRDVRGKIVRRLPCKSNEIYLHLRKDLYCLSNHEEGYVACFLLGNNEAIWHQSSKINGARNMCTDSYGNTFVACSEINEVIVVSRDGNNCKTFLNFKNPKGISFDETKSLLFVCSKDGSDLKCYRVVYG